jgi:ElaB/YqjD/DUF883 family membrane-anchored ribosome-binding protein
MNTGTRKSNLDVSGDTFAHTLIGDAHAVIDSTANAAATGAHHAVDDAVDSATTATKRLQKVANRFAVKRDKAMAGARKHVGRRPFKALGTALVVGLLISRLI